jgi:shikimate 5-dehydrogenase
MKVGIIGAGAVGSACLTALVARGCAREIVVVNRDRKRAEGLVTDLQYGAVLCPDAEVRAGDYPDLEGAALVMITAGQMKRRAALPTGMTLRAGCGCLKPMPQFTRASSRGFAQWRRRRSSS